MTNKVEVLEAMFVDMQARVAVLEAQEAKRNGPKSVREMTDDDAKRISIGDLKTESHTKCAETLGLSYGQIYSARKGFTFKKIYAEANVK